MKIDGAARKLQRAYRGHLGRALYAHAREAATVKRVTQAYHAERHLHACGFPGCQGCNRPALVAESDRQKEREELRRAQRAARVAEIQRELLDITRFGWDEDWDPDRNVPFWFRTPPPIDDEDSSDDGNDKKGATKKAKAAKNKKKSKKKTQKKKKKTAPAEQADSVVHAEQPSSSDPDERYTRPVYTYEEYCAAVSIQRIARGCVNRRMLYIQERMMKRHRETEARRAQWEADRPARERLLTVKIDLATVIDLDGLVSSTYHEREIPRGVLAAARPANGGMVRAPPRPWASQLADADASLRRFTDLLAEYKTFPWVLKSGPGIDKPYYVNYDTEETSWEPVETEAGSRLRAHLRDRMQTQLSRCGRLRNALKAETAAKAKAAQEAFLAQCQRHRWCVRGRSHRGRCARGLDRPGTAESAQSAGSAAGSGSRPGTPASPKSPGTPPATESRPSSAGGSAGPAEGGRVSKRPCAWRAWAEQCSRRIPSLGQRGCGSLRDLWRVPCGTEENGQFT